MDFIFDTSAVIADIADALVCAGSNLRGFASRDRFKSSQICF
ncbi:hypothetical protein CAMRE0001_2615 [Campylobacter rectus RM3267]|uniref:Uncharacterized protein n=1 Tax=Campylobacter rectus RM3267 TaxID=553218 RepID=B9D443_CAMRE|nr:hypothetical protein CAMRE0001_2615 [Campylobacter rectus RM3267]